jgi:hypothetical protein
MPVYCTLPTGMLQAIPVASIACVARFLFQTCRVDQVGTVYEALANCLHSVDMSGVWGMHTIVENSSQAG